MLTYLLWSFQKRWQPLAMVVAVAAILSVAYTAFLAASASTTLTADRALTDYWRTTYDLLVRHPGAVTPVEHAYGLVEANHLSGTAGGISPGQYRAIRQIEGVDLAAPIAMLGYLPRNPAALSIRDPLPSGIYRIWAQSTIQDGWQGVQAVLPAPYYTLYLASSPGVPREASGSGQTIFAEMARLRIANYNRRDGFGLSIDLPGFGDQMLVAAVDPEQEARLIHLDEMLVSGGYLPEKSVARLKNGSPSIPVLLNVHDYVNMQVSYRIERVNLPVDEEDLLASLGAIRDGGAIQNAAHEVVIEDSLRVPREWREKGLLINLQNGAFQGIQNYIGDFSGPLYSPRPVVYTVMGHSPADLPENRLVLEAQPLGLTSTVEEGPWTLGFLPQALAEVFAMRSWQRTPELVFRNMARRVSQDLSFEAELIGVFDVDPQAALAGASLNQVPLETYYPPLVQLAFDADGRALEAPARLNPTLNDAGYLVAPPDVLMDIDDVPLLFEHGCVERSVSGAAPGGYQTQRVPCTPLQEDWISAVRVRVGGIETMTAGAQAKIERIAQEIVEKTGLHVDIMVGSSPQPVLVHIRGTENVSGPGYVEELWVKKNVNTRVQKGMNRADSLLFAGMLAACLLFLFNASYLLMLSRVGELGLLRAIGWRSRDIGRLLLLEALGMGLASGLLGAGLSFAAVRLFPSAGAWERAFLLVPLGGLAFVAGALLPAWQAGRTPPVSAMRSSETRAWGSGAFLGSSFLGYAAGSLVRRPGRTAASLAGLALGSGMLVLSKLALDEMQGDLYGTLLGVWVRTQVQPYHFWMAAVALLVSALGVAAVMLFNIGQRRSEIGLLFAVGWKRRDVFRLFVLEGALIGLAAGLLGAGGAAALFLTHAPASFDLLRSLVTIAGLGVGLPVLVAPLAALYPAFRVARLLPLEALRGEERLGSARPLRAQLAWWGVALLLAAGLAVGWGQVEQIQPEVDPRPIAAIPSPAPTLPPASPWESPAPVDLQDLPQYSLALEVDAGAGELRGQEKIRFTNRTGGVLETIVLRLYPNRMGGRLPGEKPLRLTALRTTAGAEAVDAEGDDSVQLIRLTEPLTDGEALEIDLSFVLNVPPITDDESPVWKLHSFFPMLAVNEDGAWRKDVCAHCADIVYSQSAQVDMQVAAPPGWMVASSAGPAEALLPGGDKVTHVFKTRNGPVRDVALAWSPRFQVTNRQVGDTTLVLYLPDGEKDPVAAERILAPAAAAFSFFTEKFGPYPYSSLAIVGDPGSRSGGAEFPGLVYLIYNLKDPDLPRAVAHEVAHQWWYGIVGNDIFREPWLDEALAEHSALLFLESQVGRGDVQVLRDGFRREVDLLELRTGKVWPVGSSVFDFPDFSTYSTVIYRKGLLFLAELQQTIGDEAFLDGLRQYRAWYQFGVGTGRGFLEAMQQASGQDLRPLFDAWIGLANLD